VNAILETAIDRDREELTIMRLTHRTGSQAHRLPSFSVADYMITSENTVKSFVELKIRKETEEQVRSYGGIMFKHKKLQTLQQLSALTNTPVIIVFAFENGTGTICGAAASKIPNYTPETPPRRRNYRGLATDEEAVIYLDWDTDLPYRW
jgi:hypothetical protein